MTSLNVLHFVAVWMLTTIKPDVEAWSTPSAVTLRADGLTVDPVHGECWS